MAAFERRTKILDIVRNEQRVSTRALSDHFAVSEVTIRQDLALLEQQGWVARVHGGVEATARLHPEQTHAERAALNLDEKVAVARAAAETVSDGDTILIDSSTTAFQMTAFLAEKSGLRVITNQFHVARVLAAVPTIQTILLGGTLRSETWSIVGPLAEEMLAKLHAPVGFFSAAGFTLRHGFTDADPREAQMKRAMTDAVDRVTVLIDSTKFGCQSMLESLPIDRVATLFTTAAAPADICDALVQRNIDVRIV